LRIGLEFVKYSKLNHLDNKEKFPHHSNLEVNTKRQNAYRDHKAEIPAEESKIGPHWLASDEKARLNMLLNFFGFFMCD
jgi:hypothetical protein